MSRFEIFTSPIEGVAERNISFDGSRINMPLDPAVAFSPIEVFAVLHPKNK